jgi:hypothetical protein
MKKTKYSEAELVQLFSLNKFSSDTQPPLIKEWINAEPAVLDTGEQYIFDDIFNELAQKIPYWSEEDLKMNFISFVLRLGHLMPTKNIRTFFDKTIQATVQGTLLKTKIDFMVAKGVMDLPQNPYFHFQEYKRQIDPNGNPMAQLLEAMLIAQAINDNQKPIYGCCIIGKFWDFVVLQGSTYCVSQSYDCTQHDDLMQIIAILRKFKYILETRLMV